MKFSVMMNLLLLQKKAIHYSKQRLTKQEDIHLHILQIKKEIQDSLLILLSMFMRKEVKLYHSHQEQRNVIITLMTI